MLLMHFDFAPRSQKLPLGVLLHALLESFQSLAVPPRFSSTTKKDDDSKRHKGEGRRPICPEARLRLRMARVRLESPTSWQVVESQSTALGSAVTTLHDIFWLRRTSSRLHEPRECRLRLRLRCVARQNAGIRASRRGSRIDSPSKLRSRR